MKARFLFLALALTSLLASCNEYFDDLEPLGKRVEALEDSVLKMDNSLNSLEFLIQAIEKQGYITRIEDNDDGSFTIYMKGYFDGTNKLTERTITLKDGLKGADGRNGLDGLGAEALLGVAVSPNGVAYWIFNGEPLLDEDGNIVPVRGPDGKDGLDGKNGVDGKNGQDGRDGQDGKNGLDGKNGKDASPVYGEVVLPMVRINPNDRTWEISNDGGESWIHTGVSADGVDGKKGGDGTNGKEDPVVKGVEVRDTEVIFYVYVSQLGNIVQVSVPRDGNT
jgi:hypothetical protein